VLSVGSGNEFSFSHENKRVVFGLILDCYSDIAFSIGAANYMTARVTYKIPRWWTIAERVLEFRCYALVIIGSAVAIGTRNPSFSIIRLSTLVMFAFTGGALTFHSMYSLRKQLVKQLDKIKSKNQSTDIKSNSHRRGLPLSQIPLLRPQPERYVFLSS